MRTTVDITFNNIPYEENVHDNIAYLQTFLRQMFNVQVEVEIDDLDYSDKIQIAHQVRQNNVLKQ